MFTYTGPTKSEVDGLGIAATTADTLATSRNISGVAFDGSANITLNTADITENTNLYYTDARVQAVSINAVSEDTSPVLGGNLAGGSYNITTTGKIYYANMFSTVGDLPSASSYHGMFAHVHATGKGYFAHAGNWITLLDESSSTTDNLTEGSTNLYYTTARGNTDFDTRFATKDTDDLTQGTTNLYYATSLFNTDFGTKTTSDLTEGTNLYYTDARFDTRLAAKTTDNLTEGSTNLYNQTHTGDVTGSVALTIASDAVTYDKMQDLVTANRVLGGTAAGTIAEVQIATDMIAAGAVTAAKVDTDLRNVQYIGLDSTDYMEFTDNTQIDLYINGSNEFRFEADGDFHADGDVIAYSTTTPSDERLKENVKVIENPLEKLDQLRGVTFDWIDREDKRSGGIIAQELEKVMPELVREVDSLKNEDSFKAVDYNGLIGLLIEAVKELSNKCNNCNK